MLALLAILISIGIIKMSVEFDALSAQVAATNATAQTAVDAIKALASRSTEDPVAVAALTASLKSASDALATAVAAAPQPVGGFAKAVASLSDGDAIIWGT